MSTTETVDKTISTQGGESLNKGAEIYLLVLERIVAQPVSEEVLIFHKHLSQYYKQNTFLHWKSSMVANRTNHLLHL